MRKAYDTNPILTYDIDAERRIAKGDASPVPRPPKAEVESGAAMTAKPFAPLRRGEIFLPQIILFSHKTIALSKAEVSRLRARPKGFPVALWKPSEPTL